jgi:TetR/AcrR family transcriptional regulator, mexJK operon transcriptional repressor
MTALLDLDLSDSRSRLIQAATEAFIDDGYRASVEQIAARAGVARQTLYNHFTSKDDLFREVITQVTAALLISLDDEDRPLRERLLRFGMAFRSKTLSAEGLGFYRALLAEAARQPKLTNDFYNAGPARTAARLCEVLTAAMARGEMRDDDPEFATTILLSMLIGAERSNCLLTSDVPSPQDPAKVARIIDCYLRAFAPPNSLSLPVTDRSTQ